ncbi:NifU family protein [Dethiothermospora halolimnae]|uniref:NifU family protein n=1 Tax=Dethiothermospora halolimnae TaxID=3114390 RepID=UPI003CCBDDCF
MNNKLYTKIEGIIDNKIRTPLSEHNGDIKLLSVEDNVVKVSFLGSCKGCPGAQMTMETLVERAIKEDIPDIEEVILVNQVDEGLLDVARNILKK